VNTRDNYILVLVTALLAAACGPADKHRAVPRETVGPFAVHYGDGVDRARARHAIRAYVDAWDANEPTSVPTGYLDVVPGHTLPDKIGAEPSATGFWRGQRIWVSDSDGYLPALYHEMAHLKHGDGSHTDTRWAMWDSRGTAVVTSLVTERNP